jgi:hypothetical protein
MRILRQYTYLWTSDYTALSDAVLVSSDGEKFLVHAAHLNSPLINGIVRTTRQGLERVEIPLQASAITIDAILNIAYPGHAEEACRDAPFTELFKTVDLLACAYERVKKKLCERLISFMESWACFWGLEKYENKEDCTAFFRITAPDYFPDKELERVTELCVALLTTTGFHPQYNRSLRDVLRILRDVYLGSPPGWFTLMSQPHWDAVPGSVMAKFLAYVTRKCDDDGDNLFFDREPPVPSTMVVSVTLNPEDFTKDTAGEVLLDHRWSIEYTNVYDQVAYGKRDPPEFELKLRCRDRSFSRIEAEILGPGHRVILCSSSKYDIPVLPGGRDYDLSNAILGMVTSSCQVKATITYF